MLFFIAFAGPYSFANTSHKLPSWILEFINNAQDFLPNDWMWIKQCTIPSTPISLRWGSRGVKASSLCKSYSSYSARHRWRPCVKLCVANVGFFRKFGPAWRNSYRATRNVLSLVHWPHTQNMWLLRIVGVLVLVVCQQIECFDGNVKNLDIDNPQLIHSDVRGFGFSLAMMTSKPESWWVQKKLVEIVLWSLWHNLIYSL